MCREERGSLPHFRLDLALLAKRLVELFGLLSAPYAEVPVEVVVDDAPGRLVLFVARRSCQQPRDRAVEAEPLFPRLLADGSGHLGRQVTNRYRFHRRLHHLLHHYDAALEAAQYGF